MGVVDYFFIGCHLAGLIWLIVIALQEDKIQALLVFFIPFYPAYFGLTRFAQCKIPMVFYGLGILYKVTLFLTGLFR